MTKKKPTNKFKIYKIKEEYSIDGTLDDIKAELENKKISYDTINKMATKELYTAMKAIPPGLNVSMNY